MPPGGGEPIWVTLTRDAAKQELPAMKEAAKAWAGSLSTFTGLLTIVGVTVGPAALKKQVLYFGQTPIDARLFGLPLLLIILYCAVQATLRAQAAAVLKPEVVGFNPDSMMEKWYRDISTIADNLTQSRRWMSWTVTSLLAYGVLVLFSVDAKEAATPYTRVATAGGVYCGELITDQQSGRLAIRPRAVTEQNRETKRTTEPAIVLSGAITELKDVATCPYLP